MCLNRIRTLEEHHLQCCTEAGTRALSQLYLVKTSRKNIVDFGLAQNVLEAKTLRPEEEIQSHRQKNSR
jgi:hypothetical protein